MTVLMSVELLPGYYLRPGSSLDRALLVKFMQQTYQELFSEQDLSHLAQTVEQYFSDSTHLWWVESVSAKLAAGQVLPHWHQPVACLWVGNAVEQVRGDRHPHIFLLYVRPEHRRQGIGKALMCYVEAWARRQGYHQIGLQVFQSNQAALNLYHQLGYQTQSLSMVKHL